MIDSYWNTHTHKIMFNRSVIGAMLLFLRVKMTQNMKCRMLKIYKRLITHRICPVYSMNRTHITPEQYKVVNIAEEAMAYKGYAFQTEYFRAHVLPGHLHSGCLVHICFSCIFRDSILRSYALGLDFSHLTSVWSRWNVYLISLQVSFCPVLDVSCHVTLDWLYTAWIKEMKIHLLL